MPRRREGRERAIASPCVRDRRRTGSWSAPPCRSAAPPTSSASPGPRASRGHELCRTGGPEALEDRPSRPGRVGPAPRRGPRPPRRPGARAARAVAARARGALHRRAGVPRLRRVRRITKRSTRASWWPGSSAPPCGRATSRRRSTGPWRPRGSTRSPSCTARACSTCNASSTIAGDRATGLEGQGMTPVRGARPGIPGREAQDRALAPDAQERSSGKRSTGPFPDPPHPARDPLPAGRPRGAGRRLHRRLQPRPAPREPSRPHPRRRLPRPGRGHPRRTRPDQAPDPERPALAAPRARRPNLTPRWTRPSAPETPRPSQII